MSSGGDGGGQKAPDPNPPGTGGIDPTKTFGPLQGGPGIMQLPQGNSFEDAIARSLMNGYEPNGNFQDTTGGGESGQEFDSGF